MSTELGRHQLTNIAGAIVLGALAASQIARAQAPTEAIDIKVGPDMRFGLTIIERERWLITCFPNGQTNSTLVKIGDNKLELGSRPRGVVLPEGPGGSRRMRWSDQGIEVTQELKPVAIDSSKVKDTCQVRYIIKNLSPKGSSEKDVSVGLRALVDTLIKNNDGCTFLVPGKDELIDTSADFKGNQVPQSIEALEKPSRRKPGRTARFTLRRKGASGLDDFEGPARFCITRWRFGYESPDRWDVPVEDMENDSAVVLYWDQQNLKAGQTRICGYAYGKGRLQGQAPR
jgi:hypothetical protein